MSAKPLILVPALLMLLARHGFASEPDSISIQSVTAKYGKPDKVISNEFDRPRVKSVSRALVYRKQDVKYVFVPDAPEGAVPPYKVWKFVTVRSAKSDTAISAQEAEIRMASRSAPNRSKAKPNEPGATPPAAR